MDRHISPLVVLVLLLMVSGYHIFRIYAGLKHVPGPLWCKFTNFQRFFWVKTGQSHEIYQNAHGRYGDCVRVGPNVVSISNPAAIPIVYPMRPGFPKASPYTQASHEPLPEMVIGYDETCLPLTRRPLTGCQSTASQPYIIQLLECG
jgi:hypothetical protein